MTTTQATYQLPNMKQKIQTLLNQLNHGLVEREATLKTVLLTVLSRENIVLIGPPGTGKSLIARRIAERFAHEKDDGYFEYLLTKFSTPEEIFGPLSISELKQDRFKRNTAGYLPTVNIAFLDEIFKASSSILNALLTILNERVYHNGAEVQKVPLQALIAASNELPGDQEELSALYDRFLVRSFVDYVSHDNLHRLFEKTENHPDRSQLTVADLDAIQHAARSITLPPEIVQAIQSIWIAHRETFKEDRRETLSDRRLKKIIQLLCVSAATNGRKQVDLSDVLLLKDCLWNHPDNALKVRELILNTLRTFSREVPQNVGAALSRETSTMIENGIPLYELDADGETLIPVANSRARHAPTKTNPTEITVGAALSRETFSRAIVAKKGSVIKGWTGSGTAADPLQISCIEDFLDLAHPHIGQQGYYFIQTTDIDGSSITTWAVITFFGHYDGQGFSIQAPEQKIVFATVQAQSSLQNIQTDRTLIGITSNISLSNCSAGANLISSSSSSSVTGCTLSNCSAGANLIYSSSSSFFLLLILLL